MAKYLFITMSTPAEGHEQELDDWHEKVHMREILESPGWVGGQRYHIAEHQLNRPTGILPSDPDTPPPPTLDPFPFLIVYELETDDLEKTIDELYDAHLTMQKRPEGSFDDRIYYWFYKASSEYVEASPATHPRVEPKNAEKAAALAKALAHGRPR